MKLFPIAPEFVSRGAGIGDRFPTSKWQRLLREPLLHFLVVGALLFGVYRTVSPQPEPEVTAQNIELTKDDIRQLAITWVAQGRPLPTVVQLRNLADQKVTEEILFREAVALGLDRDDQIVKRRLAQKMDFLVADLAALEEPSDAELRAWFAKNADRFALPPHVSFRHLYFSPDKRGSGAREAAVAALGLIAGKPADLTGVDSIADPFMFRTYYGDATPEQMAKEFGPGFSDALFRLGPGSWQGPVQSGYGWHLVWIDSIEPGRIPAFEEVEPEVRSAWLDDRYREIRRAALEEMRSRYTVVVPPLDSVELGGLQSSGAANASGGSLSQ